MDFVARHGADATKVFRDRMNKSVATNLVTTIAQHLSDPKFDVDSTDIGFRKDLDRDLEVFIPDGNGRKWLPKNYEEAREDMLKFLTNDPDATWETADNAAKTKVRIFTAFVHQSMPQIVRQGMWEALDETGESSRSPFELTNEAGDKQWTFEFCRAENGDIKVNMHIRINYTAALTWDAKGTLSANDISKRSFEEYDCEVTFPADNLDNLSKADWRRYDPKKATDIYNRMDDTPKSRQRQANTVPNDLRFAGTADMSLHLHIV